VGIYEFDEDWPALAPGHARLLAYTAPADL
jgi:hypothetical protein